MDLTCGNTFPARSNFGPIVGLEKVLKKEVKKMPKWIKKSRKRDLMILGEERIEEQVDEIMSFTDDGFMWVKEEAAVDSGAVDCVANRKTFHHLAVTATPESIKGESWTCAGGKKLPKEGEVILEWYTDTGEMQKTSLKIGNVSRTLISVDKLLERGNDVILSKANPRIVTKNGKIIKLKRKNGMFILDMWYKVPTNGQVFTRQGS